MRRKRFCFHGNRPSGASAGAIYQRKRTFPVRDAGEVKDNYRDPFPQLGAFVNILLDVCKCSDVTQPPETGVFIDDGE